ncbi:hypothetical protein ScPMuIL_005183 [Solemya velum]
MLKPSYPPEILRPNALSVSRLILAILTSESSSSPLTTRPPRRAIMPAEPKPSTSSRVSPGRRSRMPSPDLGCKPSWSSGSEWAPTPKRARHPPTSSEKRATRLRSPHLGTDGHMLPRQYMYHPTEDGLSRWMAAHPALSATVGRTSLGAVDVHR